MIATTTNIYSVDVIFDAADKTFTFKGDEVKSASGYSIHIKPGVQLVNFSLTTINGSGGAEAYFAFYPVSWLGTPELQPANGLGQWHDSTTCRLVILNTHTSTSSSHGFVVTVLYQDKAYVSTDPTMINDPPVGGDGGA